MPSVTSRSTVSSKLASAAGGSSSGTSWRSFGVVPVDPCAGPAAASTGGGANERIARVGGAAGGIRREPRRRDNGQRQGQDEGGEQAGPEGATPAQGRFVHGFLRKSGPRRLRCTTRQPSSCRRGAPCCTAP